jgi:superfamily II DNA/RNA helicase
MPTQIDDYVHRIGRTGRLGERLSFIFRVVLQKLEKNDYPCVNPDSYDSIQLKNASKKTPPPGNRGKAVSFFCTPGGDNRQTDVGIASDLCKLLENAGQEVF